MADDASLEQAQIQFLDVKLSLVHIPLHLYAHYVSPILQLVLPQRGSMKDIPFMNITINPVEASIVCPKQFTNQYFVPLVATLGDNGIRIAPDEYLLMFVTGSNSSPSQRVINLTTPLALAGISIFFITTYFSDYIICPQRSRNVVVAALEARGFELTHDDVSKSGIATNYARLPVNSTEIAAGTPPPATLSELQVKTFATLRKSNVSPTVYRDIALLSCGCRDGPLIDQQALTLAITRAILSQPRFFSLTVAEGESPSILLEKSLYPLFESSNQHTGASHSLLLGSTFDIQIPIVLDLRSLPFESTGIVCGIAGKLVDSTKQNIEGIVEMCYLSTAQAGAVIVSERDVDRAVTVLESAATEELTQC